MKRWITRIAIAAIPAMLISGALWAQSMGEGSDFGFATFGGGTIAGPVSVTTSGPGDFFVQSLGSDTAPSSFGTNDVVIGKPVASGGTSGAVFIKYNSSTNEGVIGALSPSAAWRNLRVAGALTLFPNASTIKGVAPGVSSNNFAAASDSQYVFSSTTDASGSVDVGLSRNAAGVLQVTNGSTGNGDLDVAGQASANGQTLIIKAVTSNVTLNTGSTTTNGPSIPQDAVVIDVTSRVTTTITTAANWSVGVGGATTRYVNANTNLTSGTTSLGLDSPRKYSASTPIVITTNVNPGAGAIRITAHYFQPTAPTN